MTILYEDESIVVCVKTRGILSQTDSAGGESAVSLLMEQCQSEIYPLHRLDKDVGGVMIYAKTKSTAATLSRYISEHKFKKEYVALVYGIPNPAEGEMVDLLFKDSRKNKSFVVKSQRKGVKEAKLQYSLMDTNGKVSRVHILLYTGRSHQIRVQFASRKMPLLGDRKYGAKDNEKEIKLWSYKISFNHPVSNENLSFEHNPDF